MIILIGLYLFGCPKQSRSAHQGTGVVHICFPSTAELRFHKCVFLNKEEWTIE
jgi:hypothetical protein